MGVGTGVGMNMALHGRAKQGTFFCPSLKIDIDIGIGVDIVCVCLFLSPILSFLNFLPRQA